MKKNKKRVLGLAGLIAVIAITAFAISLPAPTAQAINSTVVDDISVRVVNNVPDITVTGLPDGSVTVNPEQSFTVNYANVDTYKVTIEYTDQDGITTIYVIDEAQLDFGTGEMLYNINLNDYGDSTNHGYGNYKITVRGEGAEGVYDEQIIEFEFLPAYAETVTEDDKYYLDVYYNYDDQTGESDGRVNSVEVKVYYPGTNQEVPFSPINVPLNESGHSRIELPFAAYGLEPGDYPIAIVAYGRDKNPLVKNPYTLIVGYKGDGTAIPNTGALFSANNISKTDYLITGLIVFGIIALTGIILIVRNKNTSNRQKRK